MNISLAWLALRRWYRLVFFLTLLAGALALLVSFLLPPTYEAEAAVATVKSATQLNFDPKIKTVSEADLTASVVDQTARRRAFTTIGKSLDTASSVISKLGDKLTSKERIPSELIRNVDATLDGDLIRLKARSDSPEKAALIANTWADEFTTQINLLYGENPLTPEDVQTQADSAFRDYQTAETAVVSFLATSSLDDLQRQVSMREQRLNDLVSLDAQLARLQGDAQALRNRLNAGGAAASRGDDLATLLLESSAFGTSATLSTTLQISLDPLSSASPADRVASLDGLLKTLGDRRKSVQSELAGPLQAELNRFRSQLEQETARKQQLTQARELAWSSYTTLSNKLAEVTIAAQSKGTVVRLASSAIPPRQPIAPKKLTNTLLAAGAALVLALAAAILYEHGRQAVGGAHEARQVLQDVAVESVPEIKWEGSGETTARILDPHSAGGEAFRLIQHLVSGLTPPPKIIAISSARAGEGKSVVTANLAAALARAGKKVIAIDANPGHPSLTAFLGARLDGIDTLASTVPEHWDTLLRPTAVENVRVVPAEGLVKEGKGVLEDPRFAAFITYLTALADFVLFDTPAALDGADAAIAARIAQGVLLVATADESTWRELERVQELVTKNSAPLVGVIMNRTRSDPRALANLFESSGALRKLVGWLGPARG